MLETQETIKNSSKYYTYLVNPLVKLLVKAISVQGGKVQEQILM